MSTAFLHPKRKTYYHRSVVPRRLMPYFKGREQLWRSLKTADKDEATLKVRTVDGENPATLSDTQETGRPYDQRTTGTVGNREGSVTDRARGSSSRHSLYPKRRILPENG